MAALTNLQVCITKATPVDDHSTYQYHISLQYGQTSWVVLKRFSEFDSLLQALANGRYGGLPRMPSKTLMGAPTDQAAIDGRKVQLIIILQDLLLRPDTRTSQQLRQFLALDSHVSDPIRSLQPDALRTFEDPRFGVSGLCVSPQANLLMVTHEDSTHLSRLGRVWSVVEPDELGALHMWGQGSDSAWKRVFSHTYGIKARSLAWEDSTRQVFVGLEDGRIEVFAVSQESLQPSTRATLELHHRTPVTHLSVSSRRLLSVGLDSAMRVIDIRNRDLLCGGRLMKRLRGESDYLSCTCLDDENDRAIIGTSGGDVFILDISRNPPNFLHTLETSTKPVAAIVVTNQRVLVAHGDCVSVFGLQAKGQEEKTMRTGNHRVRHLTIEEVTILSVAVAPERDLVFGGYSDGSVAIWSGGELEAAIVVQAHQCDTTQLVWVDSGPWGPALFTGGGEGKVVTWHLAGGSEDYALWSARTLDTEDLASQVAAMPVISSSADPLSVFEPTFGTSGDVFQVDNPRVNTQALKREGDSDSDNDLADAFR